MKFDFESDLALFQQVARELELAIFQGHYGEGDQVPSTTEISLAYQLNPATVLKGMNLLVEEGVLEKRRGMGTFVKQGALDRLEAKRRQEFKSNHLKSLIFNAKTLGLTKEELLELIEGAFDEGNAD